MDAVLIAVILSSAVIIAVLVVILLLMRSTIRDMGDRVSDGQRASGAVINQQLSDAMAQINRSMGEMRNLSSGMDDLRRIMTNVKTRGIVGEVQLGAILEEILSGERGLKEIIDAPYFFLCKKDCGGKGMPLFPHSPLDKYGCSNCFLLSGND